MKAELFRIVALRSISTLCGEGVYPAVCAVYKSKGSQFWLPLLVEMAGLEPASERFVPRTSTSVFGL
jgi:hypothetical protein